MTRSIGAEAAWSVHAMHPGVAFHEKLAPEWGRKYSRLSFRERANELFSLLDGHELVGRRWLDAGCGSGVLTALLAARGCNVTAVDASPEMVRQAERMLLACSSRGLRQPKFGVVDTIERLDWPAAAFDGILCSSVVEYLDRPKQCLREFARVLRPGGSLLLSVPNRQSLFRGAQKLCYVCTGGAWPKYLGVSNNEYGLVEFAQLLGEVGLAVRAWRYYGARVPRWLGQSRFVGGLLLLLAVRQD